MSNIQEAKAKLEAALQEFVVANYDDNHYLGDFVVSCSVIDMAGNPQQHKYLHSGRGAFHSLRGLVKESADYLIELKEEEKLDD